MTGASTTSLRLRLAVLGFLTVLAPVVVLLTVVFTTRESRTIIGPQGAEVSGRSAVSAWVPIAALILVLPVGFAAAWWASRTVRPLRRITDVMTEIEAGSLDRRIDPSGAPREVAELADSFNQLLARLSKSGELQRRLVEDASHQLRTPLAVAATSIDVLLARGPSATTAEVQLGLERTRRAVDRLQSIVNELLSEARARAVRIEQVDNDLADVVRGVADDHADAAVQRQVDLVVASCASLRGALDGPSVRRAVGSLVENALHASPVGGVVEVQVGQDRDRLFVTVSDQGAGLPPEHGGRIFERGWRDGGDGHGIGLAIVRQVADAHDGLEVQSPIGPDGGTRMTLWFRR